MGRSTASSSTENLRPWDDQARAQGPGGSLTHAEATGSQSTRLETPQSSSPALVLPSPAGFLPASHRPASLRGEDAPRGIKKLCECSEGAERMQQQSFPGRTWGLRGPLAGPPQGRALPRSCPEGGGSADQAAAPVSLALHHTGEQFNFFKCP